MDCIPPWLSSKDQCKANITYSGNHSKREIQQLISRKFIEPKGDKKLAEVEMKCKTPCRKMTNRVSLVDKEDYSDHAALEFRFQKTVKVEKKMIVYTWFNFIVDVGSSLGLWLGLSALGITDLVIEAFMVAKKWLSAKLMLFF